MAVSDWSTSAGSNTSVGGVNIGEAMARSDVNNAIRAVMAEAKAKFDQSINVRDYGAVGDGTTDDTAAIQAAIDAAAYRSVYLSQGTYKITSQITVDDTDKIILHGDGKKSIIKKYFNGDMISLGAESIINRIYLDGNGANYTGRGIVISTGALDQVSWRSIHDVDIIDTASYCIEFTADSSGYSSEIILCRLLPVSGATHAVKFPLVGGAGETNGNRTIAYCWSASNPLVDFGDCDNATLIGNTGGTPTFNTGTKKVVMNGNRIASIGSPLAIKGALHSIIGNAIAETALSFAAANSSVCFLGNTLPAGCTITDSSTGSADGNELEYQQQLYTPTWTGGSPTIGNGTLGGSWARSGRYCKVNIILTAGSTTTFGAGAWTFTLPFAAARNSTGAAFIYDASGPAFWPAVAFVDASASTIRICSAASSSAFVGSASPMAWATSDTLRLEIDYLIA